MFNGVKERKKMRKSDQPCPTTSKGQPKCIYPFMWAHMPQETEKCLWVPCKKERLIQFFFKKKKKEKTKIWAYVNIVLYAINARKYEKTCQLEEVRARYWGHVWSIQLNCVGFEFINRPPLAF